MDVPYTEIVCIGFSGSMLVMSAIVLLMLQFFIFCIPLHTYTIGFGLH